MLNALSRLAHQRAYCLAKGNRFGRLGINYFSMRYVHPSISARDECLNMKSIAPSYSFG